MTNRVVHITCDISLSVLSVNVNSNMRCFGVINNKLSK